MMSSNTVKRQRVHDPTQDVASIERKLRQLLSNTDNALPSADNNKRWILLHIAVLYNDEGFMKYYLNKANPEPNEFLRKVYVAPNRDSARTRIHSFVTKVSESHDATNERIELTTTGENTNAAQMLVQTNNRRLFACCWQYFEEKIRSTYSPPDISCPGFPPKLAEVLYVFLFYARHGTAEMMSDLLRNEDFVLYGMKAYRARPGRAVPASTLQHAFALLVRHCWTIIRDSSLSEDEKNIFHSSMCNTFQKYIQDSKTWEQYVQEAYVWCRIGVFCDVLPVREWLPQLIYRGMQTAQHQCALTLLPQYGTESTPAWVHEIIARPGTISAHQGKNLLHIAAELYPFLSMYLVRAMSDEEVAIKAEYTESTEEHIGLAVVHAQKTTQQTVLHTLVKSKRLYLVRYILAEKGRVVWDAVNSEGHNIFTMVLAGEDTAEQAALLRLLATWFHPYLQKKVSLSPSRELQSPLHLALTQANGVVTEKSCLLLELLAKHGLAIGEDTLLQVVKILSAGKNSGHRSPDEVHRAQKFLRLLLADTRKCYEASETSGERKEINNVAPMLDYKDNSDQNALLCFASTCGNPDRKDLGFVGAAILEAYARNPQSVSFMAQVPTTGENVLHLLCRNDVNLEAVREVVSLNAKLRERKRDTPHLLNQKDRYGRNVFLSAIFACVSKWENMNTLYWLLQVAPVVSPHPRQVSPDEKKMLDEIELGAVIAGSHENVISLLCKTSSSLPRRTETEKFKLRFLQAVIGQLQDVIYEQNRVNQGK